MNATITGVVASNNFCGGISVREDNIGNLSSSIANATTQGNDGRGIGFDPASSNAVVVNSCGNSKA